MRARSKRARVSSEMDEDTEAEEEGGVSDMVMREGSSVYFHAAVSRVSILLLLRHLRAAEKHAFASSVRQEHARVFLFIHSEGGDAYAGLSGMNHIQALRVHVTTVADGFVASAATFLLLAGKTRLAMPHASVLIHQLSAEFWGKYAELKDEMHNTQQLMRVIQRLYTRRTKIRGKTLQRILKSELTMTTNRCLKLGIIDGVFDEQ